MIWVKTIIWHIFHVLLEALDLLLIPAENIIENLFVDVSQYDVKLWLLNILFQFQVGYYLCYMISYLRNKLVLKENFKHFSKDLSWEAVALLDLDLVFLNWFWLEGRFNIYGVTVHVVDYLLFLGFPFVKLWLNFYAIRFLILGFFKTHLVFEVSFTSLCKSNQRNHVRNSNAVNLSKVAFEYAILKLFQLLYFFLRVAWPSLQL